MILLGRAPILTGWFRLLILTGLAALVSLAHPAICGAMPANQSVTLVFTTKASGTGLRFDQLQDVILNSAGSQQLADAVRWLLSDLNLPSGWRTNTVMGDNFLTNNFNGWMKDNLRKTYALLPPVIQQAVQLPVDGNSPCKLVVVAKFPETQVGGIQLHIHTWALGPGELDVVIPKAPVLAVDLAQLFPSATDRLQAEKMAGLDQNSKSLTQFLMHSRIILHAKPQRPATGSSGSAIDHLRATAPTALVAACTLVMNNSAFEGVTSGPNGVTQLADILGAQVKLIKGTSQAQPTATVSVAGTMVDVNMGDVDPVLGVSFNSDHMVLPQKYGGRQDRAEFKNRYAGLTHVLGLTGDWDDFGRDMNALLSRPEYFPAGGFPRFVSDAERDHVLAALAQDRRIIAAGVNANPEHGTLIYAADYLPPHGSFKAEASADSSRALTGSLAFDLALANKQDVSVAGSYGLTSASASVGYVQPKIQASESAEFLLEYSASFNRDSEVRLGNAEGPLVIVREFEAGPKATLNGSGKMDDRSDLAGRIWKRQLLYQLSASAGYRHLEGIGPADFIPPQPPRFSMLEGELRPSIEYHSAIIVRDETTKGTAGAASAGGQWDRVELDAVATLALSELVPLSRRTYTRARLDAYLLQFFGSAATGIGRTYVEARASVGALTNAAPRLDLFRLGGQNAGRGMDDGELAGRTFWSASLEGGWRLVSLIPALSSGKKEKGLLDNLFVSAGAEYGGVGGQSHEGTLFNPRRTAFSAGAGVKLFGITAGLIADSSLGLGYAWSPQSIRLSGRFYASVSINFAP